MAESVRIAYEEGQQGALGRLHVTFRGAEGEQELVRTFRSKDFARAFIVLVGQEYGSETGLDDERLCAIFQGIEVLPLPSEMTSAESEELWTMREFMRDKGEGNYESVTLVIFDGPQPPALPGSTITLPADQYAAA